MARSFPRNREGNELSIPRLQTTFQCQSPVALVTGSGAPRVGRAIALHLASLGCRLAIHANSNAAAAEETLEQLRRDSRPPAIFVGADLADAAATAAMVARVVETFGRIDILVNSAAIWSPTPLEQITPAEIRRYFDINTVGSFIAARAAGLQMVDQPSGGVIINLGDWATSRPYLDHAAYFPSKGAIEVMTRSLAVELGHRNPRVRVNCVRPGPVLLAEDVDPEDRRRIEDGMLLRRIGTAEQVAHAVQFLCENDFITGVDLPVDGGRSIYANDGLQTGRNIG